MKLSFLAAMLAALSISAQAAPIEQEGAFVCTSNSNPAHWLVIINFEGTLSGNNGANLEFISKERKGVAELFDVTSFTVSGKELDSSRPELLTFDGKELELSSGNTAFFYGSCKPYKGE